MTYYIKPHPKKTTDKEVYRAAQDAAGYVKDGELHLTSPQAHYIYVYAEGAWYMQNQQTGIRYPIGDGASPTLNLDAIDVKNAVYWGEITYNPADEEDAPAAE